MSDPVNTQKWLSAPEGDFTPWRIMWGSVPKPPPHPSANFIDHERNHAGKWATRFLCGTCHVEFTMCPALFPHESGYPDCLSPECDSYSIDRDPLALLGLGEAGPITKETR